MKFSEVRKELRRHLLQDADQDAVVRMCLVFIFLTGGGRLVQGWSYASVPLPLGGIDRVWRGWAGQDGEPLDLLE